MYIFLGGRGGKITQDLNIISKWLQMHKLTLNIQKSSYIFISKTRVGGGTPLTLNNEDLKYSCVTKYLGLFIDETLSWEHHLSNLRKKIAAPAGVLRRISHCLPKYLVRGIYYSLIHSHLQYLTIIWYPACATFIRPIQILQNKAIKNIYGLPMRYSTVDLYKNYNIMNLQSLYKYQISCYIHQVLSHSRLTDISLTLRSEIHNYSTRHCNDVEIERVLSNHGKRSIFHGGVQIYNSIPINIRKYTYKQFKRKIKIVFG